MTHLVKALLPSGEKLLTTNKPGRVDKDAFWDPAFFRELVISQPSPSNAKREYVISEQCGYGYTRFWERFPAFETLGLRWHSLHPPITACLVGVEDIHRLFFFVQSLLLFQIE